MKQLLIFLQLTTLICLLNYTYGGTINVPADYTTIQAGIDAASTGDTVLVAAGTYNEDLLLTSGVLLQGAGADVTTIQGTGTGPVLMVWELEADAAIDGFSITGGGGGHPGGGVYCYNSSPTITDNFSPTITNNVITGNDGWGVYCYNSSPTITNNVITANNGGGVSCFNDSATITDIFSPTITDNVITGNNGGGVLCQRSSPTISNNVITANGSWGINCYVVDIGAIAMISNNVITGNNGWGLLCFGVSFGMIRNNVITGNNGNGIYLYAGTASITNNLIADNSATSDGGGIYAYFFNSSTITGNVIVGNSATSDGGGIFCSAFSSATITNNVIADNSASTGGGILCFAGSSATITNNVIADNRATDYGGGIADKDGPYPSFLTIANCIIWGNDDDLYNCLATYSCIEDGDPGEGNNALDPLFVDAANGDYRLQAGSPCIDAGINLTELPPADLDGNPRIVDGDGNGTPVVDMGPYEYFIPVITVVIDIKPGSVSNPINLRSMGVIPVALISTADFDALLVDVSSVTFGPNGASPVHVSSEDVDGDGDFDLLFHFRQQETGISSDDTVATLKGVTSDGIQLIGEDIIDVVPQK